MSNKQLTLNLGGRLFTTTSSTLLNSGSSYFQALLSDRFQLDEESIFIDRSPRLFETVLDYMRSGRLSSAVLDCKELRAEFAFYGLVFPPVPRPRRGKLCIYGRIVSEPNLVWIPENEGCCKVANLNSKKLANVLASVGKRQPLEELLETLRRCGFYKSTISNRWWNDRHYYKISFLRKS